MSNMLCGVNQKAIHASHNPVQTLPAVSGTYLFIDSMPTGPHAGPLLAACRMKDASFIVFAHVLIEQAVITVWRQLPLSIDHVQV